MKDISSLAHSEIIKYIEFLSSFRSDERIDLFKNVIEKRTNYFTVVLENITKPHNASAVIRSCECFGIQNVHFIDDDKTYDVSKSVVMGSSKWVTLNKHNQFDKNSEHTLLHLKKNNYRIVATVPNENANALHNFNIEKGPAAFVFGNELAGISEVVANMADEFVYIPMVGFTDSLNLSVSAAIILQHVTNELYSSTVDWQLSELEKDKIVLDWLRKSTPKISFVEKRFFDSL